MRSKAYDETGSRDPPAGSDNRQRGIAVAIGIVVVSVEKSSLWGDEVVIYERQSELESPAARRGRGFEWTEAWKSGVGTGSFLVGDGLVVIGKRFGKHGTRLMTALLLIAKTGRCTSHVGATATPFELRDVEASSMSTPGSATVDQLSIVRAGGAT